MDSPSPVLYRPPSDRAEALALFGEAQRRASLKGVVLREPPPEPTSCCGRGCNGCVWEGYLAAAEYWREEALQKLCDGPV